MLFSGKRLGWNERFSGPLQDLNTAFSYKIVILLFNCGQFEWDLPLNLCSLLPVTLSSAPSSTHLKPMYPLFLDFVSYLGLLLLMYLWRRATLIWDLWNCSRITQGYFLLTELINVFYAATSNYSKLVFSNLKTRMFSFFHFLKEMQ